MDRVQRKNLRMEGYDYSTVGYYFVTVVTVGRRELFGRVVGGRFLPKDAGAMVGRCINDLETRFKGLEVLNSAVMPNHVHAILFNNNGLGIPEVMRQFKAVTSRLYRKGMETCGWREYDMRLWQRSYYDVIIRNRRMFDFINNYITVNPERWMYDKMNEKHADVVDEIYKTINILR